MWLLAGVTVLALGAGAGMWLVNEGEKEIVLAGTAPLPATPAPAAELATEPVPVRGTADEVSTAAILDETPVIADKAAPESGKKEGDDELTKMLEHGMPAAQPAGAAVPPMAMADGKGAAAPARPVAARAAKPARPVAKKAPVKKPVAKATPGASNVAPRPRVAAPAKKKTEVHPKAAAPVDSDVALLAALVAHSKATQPKGSTGLGAKLKQCKSLGSVAEANQCRARVCAGARNEAECKLPNAAKTSSGTQ